MRWCLSTLLFLLLSSCTAPRKEIPLVQPPKPIMQKTYMQHSKSVKNFEGWLFYWTRHEADLDECLLGQKTKCWYTAERMCIEDLEAGLPFTAVHDDDTDGNIDRILMYATRKDITDDRPLYTFAKREGKIVRKGPLFRRQGATRVMFMDPLESDGKIPWSWYVKVWNCAKERREAELRLVEDPNLLGFNRGNGNVLKDGSSYKIDLSQRSISFVYRPKGDDRIETQVFDLTGNGDVDQVNVIAPRRRCGKGSLTYTLMRCAEGVEIKGPFYQSEEGLIVAPKEMEDIPSEQLPLERITPYQRMFKGLYPKKVEKPVKKKA